jgi:hypothetical protein
MKNTNKQSGLIKMIIVIVIAIAILSWYGVDIKEFFTSEQAQKNFGYVWNFISDVWTTYLADPAHKLWGIWVTYFWDPFMGMLAREDHTGALNP